MAAIRVLNRLECAGETLRHALTALAVSAPDWLRAWVPSDWFDRYAWPFAEYRLPSGRNERYTLAETIGADGFAVLNAVSGAEAPTGLRTLPAVETLRQVWVQQFYPVVQIRFAQADCQACPSRAQCTQAATQPRTLTLRAQATYEALQAARQRQATHTFKEQYAARAGIEGTISQRVRVGDLRHARYVGLAETHLQHVLTATG